MQHFNKTNSFLFITITVLSLLIPSIAGAAITLSLDKLILDTGNTLSFNINGGNNSYAASISNDTVAEVSITGNKGTITGLSGGTATLTVEDTDGKKISKPIYVNDIDLSQTQVISKKNEMTSISIQSGSGSYNTTVKDPNIATSYISADEIEIEALAIGSTEITLSDTKGNLATIIFTVEQGIDKDVNLIPGGTETLQLTAGSGFYNTALSDPNIATATVSNDEVEIVALFTGTTTATITDIGGVSFIINITVKLPPPVLNEVMDQGDLTLSWSAVTGADAYSLLFSPFAPDGTPDVNKLETFALGDVNSVGPVNISGISGIIALQASQTGTPSITSNLSNLIMLDGN